MFVGFTNSALQMLLSQANCRETSKDVLSRIRVVSSSYTCYAMSICLGDLGGFVLHLLLQSGKQIWKLKLLIFFVQI